VQSDSGWKKCSNHPTDSKHEGVTMIPIQTGNAQSSYSAYLLRRIEKFVDDRIESRIGIRELAGNVGYSPSHFCRLFKRLFGTTPHSYVMGRRLALAQRLITTTSLCLTEIALQAGFADHSHLCRNFRRFAGLAPRAFRMRSANLGGGRGASASFYQPTCN
jgi:AraC family transcriptional regulator